MEAFRYLALVAMYCLVAGLIIFIGWDEPLRYRFMSPVTIAAEESAMRPLGETAPPADPPEPVSTGSALDRGPWRADRQGRNYSRDDARAIGTPTETVRR